MAKEFLSGLIVGIIITLLGIFMLNPISSIQTNSRIFIKPDELPPHYEFFNDNSSYTEYYEMEDLITPPAFNIMKNNILIIKIPEGYTTFEKTLKEPRDCFEDNMLNTEKIITTKKTKFTYPSCKFKSLLSKKVVRENLVEVNYNSSWRRELSYNSSFEEIGIVIKNNRNAQIYDYVLLYDQNKIKSEINHNLSECKEIKIFNDKEDFKLRSNFFENNNLIATKINLEPKEIKQLIIRCIY